MPVVTIGCYKAIHDRKEKKPKEEERRTKETEKNRKRKKKRWGGRIMRVKNTESKENKGGEERPKMACR